MLCPHCNQPLVRRKVKGYDTDLDYCSLCNAAWFDRGDVRTLLGAGAERAVAVPDNSVRLDDMLCPSCGIALNMFVYPGTGRVIEACGSCGGVWIDHEDLDEIRELPPAEDTDAVSEAEPTRADISSPRGPISTTEKVVVSGPEPRIVRERIRYSEKYGLAFSKLLLQSSSLRVDQEIPHWAETRLRLVVPSSYRVRSLRGSTLGWIEEQGEGLRALIRRTVRRRNRPFVMHVRGSVSGDLVLEITRRDGILTTAVGEQRFGSVRRQGDGAPNGWDLLDAGGRRFASARFQDRPAASVRSGAAPADWPFVILSETGATDALITKKWAGEWKETTTDSDNFRLDFGTHRWTPEEPAVLFSTIFAIDFDLFEDDNPRDGRIDR